MPALTAFAGDLADGLTALAPGCDIKVTDGHHGALVAVLWHRVTDRLMRVWLGADGYWTVSYAGACMSGRSAYGFDSAVTHGYRHDLDFTAEHGPGTAWDYRVAGPWECGWLA